jgi:hypothetical protein
MAPAALGSRNAQAYLMLTPAILSIAWINQAAAWWVAPWLALPQNQAPQAGHIS